MDFFLHHERDFENRGLFYTTNEFIDESFKN